MDDKPPLIHILVVGFHHKKGCQVEFSYPELSSSAWKYLPTLALPDGSHNFGMDTVYFNLPSLYTPTESIFGVSCYRQIPVEKLKNITADVTRSSVQKSVLALCSVPIYGYIEVKLSLIADCFFNQGDFECTDILRNAYEQLNACLLDNKSHFERVPGLSPVESLLELDMSTRNMFHIGLPLRDLLLKWRQKVLILFKLLLLQKRVVCFGSPVRPMCDLILSISSLHPQLIESGFRQVACVRTSRPMSPMPDFPSPVEEDEDYKRSRSEEMKGNPFQESKSPEGTGPERNTPSDDGDTKSNNSESRTVVRGFSRETSVDTLAATLTPLCSVNPSEWGAPLPIFQGGCLCLPYLSLPYMDLLTDPSVIGYFIGTSNILFQQKRNLADVLIDTESMQMEVADVDLRRQIQLTTEDLRFFDFILRNVQYPKEGAEGSDRWIREQFQGYIFALLKSSLLPEGTKEVDHFNGMFMNQFKRTNCYVDWFERNKDLNQRLPNVPTGHPFAGTMSVQDVKLKFANTIQSTEGGRKLNQAVNTTSKAVGGAITNAKGALSNWWSAMTTAQPSAVENGSTTATPARKKSQEKGIAEEEDDLRQIDEDLEIVSSFAVEIVGDNKINDVISATNVQVGTEAEEFLESEVAEAKRVTDEQQDAIGSHKTGDVFTV